MLALGAVLALAGACSEEPAPGVTQTPAPVVPFGRERVFRDLVLYPRPHEAGGPFFLDRFETTRGDFDAWLRATQQPPPAPVAAAGQWGGSHPQPDTLTLPVTAITLGDARRFAAWCFARLPRTGEWVHAATGSGLYRNPWGDSMQETFANTLELDLGRLQPVGTFESGREPGHAYDLVGNAAEWTETVPDWFFDPGVIHRQTAWGSAWQALAAAGLTRPGLAAPAAWLVAAAGRRAPRQVVGGHWQTSLGEYGAREEPREMAPTEWSSVVGMRLASDPASLLDALLRADRAGLRLDDRTLAALSAFLRTGEVRAVLQAEWQRSGEHGPARGPLAALLAAELTR